MGSGIAMAGLAQGLASGLKLGSDLADAEERRAALKEQGERDKVRFEFEKKQMAEKEGQIKARQDFANEMTAINTDATGGKNGFEQFGYVAPQQSAIAGPDQQPQQQNPFKTTADGLYKNQRGADMMIADRRAAAMEKLYAQLGEPEKAALVRSQMADVFDKDVERKTKHAMADMAMGTPGAVQKFAKVYSYFNDGNEVNPNSGTFDPKTKTWKGVEFVDAKGNKATRDITQGDIAGWVKNDASAIALFNIEQEWKQKDYNLKERSTRADETRAGAAVTEANAKVPYYKAYAGRLTALTDSEKSAASQKASVEAIARLFPEAHKEYKPEELMLDKDKGAGKLKTKAEALEMNNMTVDLAALNPKADVRALASLARKMRVSDGVTAEKDADGRVFTTYGGVKYYLP